MLHLISQVLSSKLETERYVIACLFPPILCDCLSVSTGIIVAAYCSNQRWSRGHKARGQGQGHKKIRGQGQPFRGQTLSRPRTGMLEAKDQGHKLKCSPKKKVFAKIFQAISKKKRKVFTKIFQAIPTKKRFPKNFSSAPQNFNNSKKVLSSSRGQANFRGLEVSRPRTSSRTPPLALIQLQNSIFYRQHYNLGGLSLRNYTKYTTK